MNKVDKTSKLYTDYKIILNSLYGCFGTTTTIGKEIRRNIRRYKINQIFSINDNNGKSFWI